MKNSIEELIKYHEAVLKDMADSDPANYHLEQPVAVKETIEILKSYKKWLCNPKGENYVVSMSLHEYKKYQDFKEFLAFKTKKP